MEFVKIENGEPVGKPIDRLTLGHKLPTGISFPLVMSPELLALYGYAPAMSTPPPRIGLLEVAEPDGYLLVDGVYLQTWAVSMQSDVQEAKAAALVEIAQLARRKREVALAEHAPLEIVCWPAKRAEALAYRQSRHAEAAPLLAYEATARGIELAELAARVVEKSERQMRMEARIAAVAGRKRDGVRRCDTVEAIADELAALESGWPL